MSYPGMSSRTERYRRLDLEAGVESANPHRLVQLLLEGAITRVGAAAMHLRRGDLARKGEQVGRGLAVIEGLRTSLDHREGGGLAADLERLYDYMARRLLAAHAANDAEGLEEVAALLRTLKSGWDSIGADAAGPLEVPAARAAFRG